MNAATLTRFSGAVASLARRIDRFKAWRVSPDSSSNEARPIDVSAVETLKEAVALALMDCSAKDLLIVAEHDPRRDASKLHMHRVKRSNRTGHYRPSTNGGAPVFERGLDAEPLPAFWATAFEPARPFDALRDCATGIDRTLIEQKDASNG